MVRTFWKPVMAVLAIFISLYGLIQYFVLDPKKAGLVMLHILDGISYNPWIVFLYFHIAGGVIALALGPIQFSKKLQARKKVHRLIGKIYVLSILIGGLSGYYVSATALGGIISQIGFICLDTLWLFTTYMGYKTARERKIEIHKRWMMRSYALTFAGVTLRFWTILLTFLFVDLTQMVNPEAVPTDFVSIYRWIAWLCWVPNLIFIEYVIRLNRKKSRNNQTSVSLA